MGRSAINVVKEYIERPEPAIRRNVAAALAAIGDREALQDLVELAIGDSDSTVRRAAVCELAGLDTSAAALAYKALVQRLREGSREQRRAVSSVMDELRRLGASLPAPSGGMVRRFTLAWSTGSLQTRAPEARSPLRAMMAGFLGSAPAVLCLGLYLYAIFGRSPLITTLTTVLLVALGVAPLLALLATRRAVPFGSYYDRTAGLLACLLDAAAIPFGAGVVVFLAVANLAQRQAPETLRTIKEFLPPILLGGLWLAGFVVSVRLATIAASSVSAGKPLRHACSYLAGTAAGFVGLTSGLLLFLRWVGSESMESFAKTSWLFLLPACGGVAEAFTRIDQAEIAKFSGSLRHLLRVVTVLLTALLPAALLAGVGNGRRLGWGGSAAVHAALEGKVKLLRWHASRGSHLSLHAAFRQRISIDTKPLEAEQSGPRTPSEAASRNQLQLRSSTGWEVIKPVAALEREETSRVSSLLATEPFSGAISTSNLLLDAGEYVIDVGDLRLADIVDVLSTPRHSVVLAVVLNAERDGVLKEVKAEEVLKSSGSWKVGEVPSMLTFELPAESDVTIRLPEEIIAHQRKENTFRKYDFLFALRNAEEKKLDEADDPPELHTHLSPGQYTIEVDEFGRQLEAREGEEARHAARVRTPVFTIDLVIKQGEHAYSTPSATDDDGIGLLGSLQRARQSLSRAPATSTRLGRTLAPAQRASQRRPPPR
jgi:hypothetical protein